MKTQPHMLWPNAAFENQYVESVRESSGAHLLAGPFHLDLFHAIEHLKGLYTQINIRRREKLLLTYDCTDVCVFAGESREHVLHEETLHIATNLRMTHDKLGKCARHVQCTVFLFWRGIANTNASVPSLLLLFGNVA